MNFYKQSLNNVLFPLFKKLEKGIILDVGAGKAPYKKFIPYTKYITLDNRYNPDINCDIHNIKCKSNYFDTVIITEVIGYSYNPQKVINEIYKVLKFNGICILSTKFIYPNRSDNLNSYPIDYYRFTDNALKYLFRKFNEVKIYAYGNIIQNIWCFINNKKLNKILNIFNPLINLICFKDKRFPIGYVIFAKK